MERYAELPHLMFDGAGALWMVFRHWTLTKPNEIFHNYATRLDGAKWSSPWLLAESSSPPNSQHAALAVDRGRQYRRGLSERRAFGNRYSNGIRNTRFITTSIWHRFQGAPSRLGSRLWKPSWRLRGKPGPRRPRASMQANGQSYTLLMGDAHRHTDIRGHSGVDGSVLDTYRYAIDAAQLDWLGTSDHNEVTGGRWPDGFARLPVVVHAKDGGPDDARPGVPLASTVTSIVSGARRVTGTCCF